VGRDGDAGAPDDVLGRAVPGRRRVDEVAVREAQRGAVAEELVEVFGGWRGGVPGGVLGVHDGDRTARAVQDEVRSQSDVARLVEAVVLFLCCAADSAAGQGVGEGQGEEPFEDGRHVEHEPVGRGGELAGGADRAAGQQQFREPECRCVAGVEAVRVQWGSGAPGGNRWTPVRWWARWRRARPVWVGSCGQGGGAIVSSGAPSSWRRSLTRNVSEDSSGWSTKRTRRSAAVRSVHASHSGTNADRPLSSPSRNTRCTAATTSAPSDRSATTSPPWCLKCPQ
jgi:hypothetical protein